jgi:predicted enzyme related to lactoylglutathione lyase
MTEVGVLFAGVPVTDFAVAHAWYARLFGRPADIVVHDTEVMWRFADAAWLYVVADAQRAGHALVSMAVPDLDQAMADFGTRGISAGPVEIVGEAGRKASVTDADGNRVSFIQVSAAGG